jgi:hypothetical protein
MPFAGKNYLGLYLGFFIQKKSLFCIYIQHSVSMQHKQLSNKYLSLTDNDSPNKAGQVNLSMAEIKQAIDKFNLCQPKIADKETAMKGQYHIESINKLVTSYERSDPQLIPETVKMIKGLLHFHFSSCISIFQPLIDKSNGE